MGSRVKTEPSVFVKLQEASWLMGNVNVVLNTYGTRMLANVHQALLPSQWKRRPRPGPYRCIYHTCVFVCVCVCICVYVCLCLIKARKPVAPVCVFHVFCV